jgi:hypothetical protein
MPALIPIITDDPITSARAFGALSGHLAGSLGTILSYTVSGSPLYLDAIRCEGNSEAEYTIEIGGSTADVQRSAVATPQVQFLYPTPTIVAVGDVIDVKVLHHDAGLLCDFRASLFGHKC